MAEKITKWVGVAGVVYTLLMFLVEIGYFWDLGSVAMSAFSLSDHILHAQNTSVLILGATFVLIFAMFVVPAFAEAEQDPEAEEKGLTQARGFHDYFLFLVLLAFVLPLAISLARSVMDDGGFDPITSLETSIVVALAAGVIAQVFQMPKGAVWGPILVALMVTPSAFGYWQYSEAVTAARAQPIDIKVGARTFNGGPIFIGSGRMILRERGRNILVSEDASFVMPIPFAHHPNPIPPKLPGDPPIAPL